MYLHITYIYSLKLHIDFIIWSLLLCCHIGYFICHIISLGILFIGCVILSGTWLFLVSEMLFWCSHMDVLHSFGTPPNEVLVRVQKVEFFFYKFTSHLSCFFGQNLWESSNCLALDFFGLFLVHFSSEYWVQKITYCLKDIGNQREVIIIFLKHII